MKKFSTGYNFIDERAEEIKKSLPENLQQQLNYILIKTHSLGIHEGYSEGIKTHQQQTQVNN
jgi:hypothetical protein